MAIIVLDGVSVADVAAGRTVPDRQVVLDGVRVAAVTDAGAPPTRPRTGRTSVG